MCKRRYFYVWAGVFSAEKPPGSLKGVFYTSARGGLRLLHIRERLLHIIGRLLHIAERLLHIHSISCTQPTSLYHQGFAGVFHNSQNIITTHLKPFKGFAGFFGKAWRPRRPRACSKSPRTRHARMKRRPRVRPCWLSCWSTRQRAPMNNGP